jgi:hypothetical protein
MAYQTFWLTAFFYLIRFPYVIYNKTKAGTYDAWKAKLSSVLEGHEPRDIKTCFNVELKFKWNVNEPIKR